MVQKTLHLSDILCEPVTLAPLTFDTTTKSYQSADKTFEQQDGVVRFLEKTDDFYEGAYTATVKWLPKSERWYDIAPLWLLCSNYVWQVRKHIAAKSTVLEVGCGGGIAYFGQRYNMIGLDLSFGSLKCCPDSYVGKLQCDATQLPVQSNSVDAVISAFFWEHIPPNVKPLMLQEFYRVLKPGGKLLFFYDIETQNKVIGKIKQKDMAFYQKEFLDHDGHLGYQTPSENSHAMTANGFQIIENIGVEKTVFQSASVFEKLSKLGGASGVWSKIVLRIVRLPVVNKLYFALIIWADKSIGSWLPLERARMLMTIAKKG